MAEEPKQQPGIQLQLGHVHLTATVALLGAVASGFYAGVEWITRMQETTREHGEELIELAHKIDGLAGVLAAANERDNQSNDAVNERMFEIQRQLADMLTSYRRVGTLEERYDRAFSTYQPQPKRRR